MVWYIYMVRMQSPLSLSSLSLSLSCAAAALSTPSRVRPTRPLLPLPRSTSFLLVPPPYDRLTQTATAYLHRPLRRFQRGHRRGVGVEVHVHVAHAYRATTHTEVRVHVMAVVLQCLVLKPGEHQPRVVVVALEAKPEVLWQSRRWGGESVGQREGGVGRVGRASEET